MPSSGPSGFGRNEHYASHGEYLAAVGEAMRVEYLAIVDAGFVLQIDDPWLMEILSDPTTDDDTKQRGAQEHIDVLNHSLRGIPRDSIRHHICYGLNHGPRLTDIPLATAIPWMMKIDAGAYSFEVANPRHQHEWRAWEGVDLPDDACLIPGLLGHATNYVEHPVLIADMIELYAGIVGSRARHRRCRLRVLVPGDVHPGGAPRRRLGEVRGPRRRRPDRDDPAVELRRR